MRIRTMKVTSSSWLSNLMGYFKGREAPRMSCADSCAAAASTAAASTTTSRCCSNSSLQALHAQRALEQAASRCVICSRWPSVNGKTNAKQAHIVLQCIAKLSTARMRRYAGVAAFARIARALAQSLCTPTTG